jgi:hypothetical protein
MRSGTSPVTFSIQASANHGAASFCIAPCETELLPGDYRLALNGLAVDGTVALRRSGTLNGEYHSRGATRSGAWLALNVGGIIGGVFLTVGALGGSKSAFIVGGSVLAASGLIFLVTYRADRGTIRFTPGEPEDVRGMPAASAADAALSVPEERGLVAKPQGLGFRVAF